MLEVRLIRTFSIKCDNKPITLSSRAAQSLFAYLILTAGNFHRREKLAGMFWPDAKEEKARAYLRHELWRIRKALPPSDFLISDGIGIGFDASQEFRLDAEVVEKIGEIASADELINSLSAYQGELLPGFYDEWVILEREHMQAVFEQKMARLLDLLEREKRWLDMVEWAERWISMGQGPETAYRALMIAYSALEDYAKVASSYERCVRSLEELGLEPSQETRAAAKKRVSKIKIPIPLTSFIGRENELKEVATLLSKSRLVTLTGSGGVGKTRMALQVVADVLDLFPDGVWFLDLAILSDPTWVLNALAEVLGLSLSSDSGFSITKSVTDHLGSRKALITFDNCEHLIEPCAQLIHSLLTACENLTILVTSREALRVSGEVSYRVPSLELPRLDQELGIDILAETESLRLFTERAALLSKGFAVSEHNALTIAHICQRLGGIPLAIELAAARVNMLTIDQILNRLDDRFNLLTGGLRSALPRHRTLLATIEWSYDLLSEKERLLFQRLAVFTGGWTLEAAETVCSGDGIETHEVLALLSQLVDKSLVLAETLLDGTRYRRLETIRQFAYEKMVLSGEDNKVRRQHYAYFLSLGEQADRETYWPSKHAWKDRLETDNDNFRAALEWCVSEENTEAALRLLGVWAVNGRLPFGEIQDRFNVLLTLPNVDMYSAPYAKLLNYIGWSSWLRGDYKYAKTVAEESQAIWLKLGEAGELGLADVLDILAEIALVIGEDFRDAKSLFERSLELYQKHGNEWGIGRVIYGMGHMAWKEGCYTEAEERYMQALERWKKVDYDFGEVLVSNELGELARHQGDYDRAGKFYKQCLKVSRKTGDQALLSINSFNYAWVSLHLGDYRKARELFQESLGLDMKDGNSNGVIGCLEGFAGVLVMTGKHKEAAQLFGVSESLFQSSGQVHKNPTDQKEVDYYLSVLRGQLDEATFEKAWAVGSEMSLEQAISFALKETGS